MSPFKEKDADSKKTTPEDVDLLESLLEPFFLFSLVWSVGCTVDYDGRKKFDNFLRTLSAQKRAKVGEFAVILLIIF